MKRRRDPFQAIADPTRRAIIVLLAAQAMPSGDIAGHFDIARPAISKHIRILSECDLIEARPKGRNIYYSLKIENMKQVDVWLEQLRQIWETRYDQLDGLLAELKSTGDDNNDNQQ